MKEREEEVWTRDEHLGVSIAAAVKIMGADELAHEERAHGGVCPLRLPAPRPDGLRQCK